jgi:hypothetical protein
VCSQFAENWHRLHIVSSDPGGGVLRCVWLVWWREKWVCVRRVLLAFLALPPGSVMHGK